MIILFWFLNFAISWLNAWGCGKSWNETKHEGGFPHFINWCAAIMSAAGFTWCYLVILGGLGSVIPVKADDGTTHMLLSGASAEAFAELGYLLVLGPILGSGLALTLHSWCVAWRERNFSSVGTAAWNTFAQVYNSASAMRYAPEAARGLSKFFKSDSDSKDRGKLLVIALVALAAIGGILTTRAIIRSTAHATAWNRKIFYESRAA